MMGVMDASRPIFLTFDQDWAPAWATVDVCDLLTRAGLRGTLFVTHGGAELDVLREAGWELGWHPNFLPGSSHGAGIEEVLTTLEGWVPEARGARAHTLIRGTPYLEAYRRRGLLYDAADLRDGEPGLAPFRSWTGMWRLPIFFEDDVRMERALPLSVNALRLDRPGLQVCTFHPVLLALNACDLEGYRALKAELSALGKPLTQATRADIASHRQAEVPGLWDLLTELVSSQANRCGGTLSQLVQSL